MNSLMEGVEHSDLKSSSENSIGKSKMQTQDESTDKTLNQIFEQMNMSDLRQKRNIEELVAHVDRIAKIVSEVSFYSRATLERVEKMADPGAMEILSRRREGDERQHMKMAMRNMEGHIMKLVQENREMRKTIVEMQDSIVNLSKRDSCKTDSPESSDNEDPNGTNAMFESRMRGMGMAADLLSMLNVSPCFRSGDGMRSAPAYAKVFEEVEEVSQHKKQSEKGGERDVVIDTQRIEEEDIHSTESQR